MSPILFALFVEDLEVYIQTNNCSGLSFQDISLILLLFADDMVIFGHGQEDLENSLNMLSQYRGEYCKKKVIVFRRSGRLGREVQFLLENSSLDVVDNFNYLALF